jgi:diadenosine tetraphosphate (Ap4A) HIT family hydrolase
MQNDLKKAMDEGRAPWRDTWLETSTYTVFKDGFPVSEGHLLFVPTQENWNCLEACYRAAYLIGVDGVLQGKWDAFNIGQNVGEAAGQTVMYPHVHMIPRRKGDVEDPRGGIRHVIPSKGNYTDTDINTDTDRVDAVMNKALALARKTLDHYKS